MRDGLRLVTGALLSLAGLYAISRHDAPCVIEARHPATRTVADPLYGQELSLLPVRWECTWPGVDGVPMTTYVDPLATVLFYGGVAMVAVVLLTAALRLSARPSVRDRRAGRPAQGWEP